MIINKFNSEEALCESYQKLEKEFTKKCQELARVKKELESISSKPSESAEIESVENLEPEVEINSLEFEDVVLPEGIIESEDKPLEEVVVKEEVSIVKEEPKENDESLKTTQNEYFNLDFRAKAGEFMQKTPEARSFAKEISKILLTDKSLLNCSDPFGVAYALALKNAGSKPKDLKTSQEKEIEEELALTPQMVIPKISILSSSVIGSSPRESKKRYNSIADAGEEVLKLLRLR